MKHASISEFVEKVQTWDPRKQGAGTTLRYIDIGSVSQVEKVIEDPPIIQAEEAPSRARQIVKAGDILISTVRPNLNAVALVPEELDGATASTGFSILRPDDTRLDRSYLFHWVRTQAFVSEMMRQATGQSYPAVSDKIVKSSQIPLPPLEEQRRIAGILDQADALRRLRTRAIDKLNTLGQAIFHEMFGDPIENPNDWPVVELGNLFTLKHGFAFKSENFVSEGLYCLLTPGNFFEKGGFRDRGERQKFHDDPVPPEYILDKGDVLIAMTEQAPGLLGSPIVVPDSGKFLHNQRLGKVEKQSEIASQFIFGLMNAQSIRARIQKDSTGLKVKHTSPSKISSIHIGVPPYELQVAYSEILASLEGQVAKHAETKEQLSLLFSSLQHQAFRGEL